jgi:hypothetical protein
MALVGLLSAVPGLASAESAKLKILVVKTSRQGTAVDPGLVRMMNHFPGATSAQLVETKPASLAVSNHVSVNLPVPPGGNVDITAKSMDKTHTVLLVHGPRVDTEVKIPNGRDATVQVSGDDKTGHVWVCIQSEGAQ